MNTKLFSLGVIVGFTGWFIEEIFGDAFVKSLSDGTNVLIPSWLSIGSVFTFVAIILIVIGLFSKN